VEESKEADILAHPWCMLAASRSGQRKHASKLKGGHRYLANCMGKSDGTLKRKAKRSYKLRRKISQRLPTAVGSMPRPNCLGRVYLVPYLLQISGWWVLTLLAMMMACSLTRASELYRVYPRVLITTHSLYLKSNDEVELTQPAEQAWSVA
jgi:hypothetical protein